MTFTIQKSQGLSTLSRITRNFFSRLKQAVPKPQAHFISQAPVKEPSMMGRTEFMRLLSGAVFTGMVLPSCKKEEERETPNILPDEQQTNNIPNSLNGRLKGIPEDDAKALWDEVTATQEENLFKGKVSGGDGSSSDMKELNADTIWIEEHNQNSSRDNPKNH